MAYKNNGTFNVLYKTRNKIAKTLRRIIAEENLIDTEALYDSIRINAKIPALGELEIQINAMYYFGYLNNGTENMLSFDLCEGDFTKIKAVGELPLILVFNMLAMRKEMGLNESLKF